MTQVTSYKGLIYCQVPLSITDESANLPSPPQHFVLEVVLHPYHNLIREFTKTESMKLTGEDEVIRMGFMQHSCCLVGMSICIGVDRRCPMTIGTPIIEQAENAEIARTDHMYV